MSAEIALIAFKNRLSKKIALYDRMVDETDFQVDQEIYNGIAHALRGVRDDLLAVMKEQGYA